MRKATVGEFQRLREMSAECLTLTGEQNYLYCTQPAATERFVFADQTISGIENALHHMSTLLDTARENKS